MEISQEYSDYQMVLVKGKRTKRPRGLSPADSSCSSGGGDGGGGGAVFYSSSAQSPATSTSQISTDEDEDMANCQDSRVFDLRVGILVGASSGRSHEKTPAAAYYRPGEAALGQHDLCEEREKLWCLGPSKERKGKREAVQASMTCTAYARAG
nr:zinc finger protein ZAT5-like [Ipomoea trifida]